MKQQLELQENVIKDLQTELDKLKIQEINNQQHWNTMQMLFSDQKTAIFEPANKTTEVSHKAVQVQFGKTSSMFQKLFSLILIFSV